MTAAAAIRKPGKRHPLQLKPGVIRTAAGAIWKDSGPRRSEEAPAEGRKGAAGAAYPFIGRMYQVNS